MGFFVCKTQKKPKNVLFCAFFEFCLVFSQNAVLAFFLAFFGFFPKRSFGVFWSSKHISPAKSRRACEMTSPVTLKTLPKCADLNFSVSESFFVRTWPILLKSRFSLIFPVSPCCYPDLVQKPFPLTFFNFYGHIAIKYLVFFIFLSSFRVLGAKNAFLLTYSADMRKIGHFTKETLNSGGVSVPKKGKWERFLAPRGLKTSIVGWNGTF